MQVSSVREICKTGMYWPAGLVHIWSHQHLLEIPCFLRFFPNSNEYKYLYLEHQVSLRQLHLYDYNCWRICLVFKDEGCFRTYQPNPDNVLPSLVLWYKYCIYTYKHMQPLGLGDHRRVSESSSDSAFPIPPGKSSLFELENSSSRVKFAGFPFNLELSSDWLCSSTPLAWEGIFLQRIVHVLKIWLLHFNSSRQHVNRPFLLPGSHFRLSVVRIDWTKECDAWDVSTNKLLVCNVLTGLECKICICPVLFILFKFKCV